MFFINDEQAQIIEFDMFGKQCMGADDDIDLPRFDFFFHRIGFFGGD